VGTEFLERWIAGQFQGWPFYGQLTWAAESGVRCRLPSPNPVSAGEQRRHFSRFWPEPRGGGFRGQSAFVPWRATSAPKAACRIRHNECSLCSASPVVKPTFHDNLRQILSLPFSHRIVARSGRGLRVRGVRDATPAGALDSTMRTSPERNEVDAGLSRSAAGLV
jgi:hypothetical protein